MTKLLTPREVGVSLRVSESSVKRWCDKGLIDTQYTAGGHRRIPAAAFVDFVKRSRRELVRPEAVGLPTGLQGVDKIGPKTVGLLTGSLLRGDEEGCRRILLGVVFSGHGLGMVCDHLLAPSLEAIGQRWAEGTAAIYRERRACEIVTRGLHELRRFVPPPAARASRAVGASPEGDPFALPTAMVELVLRGVRWDAISLGTNLPISTLHVAIEENRPQLFWLSCSSIRDETKFLREYGALYEQYGREIKFVVGGRALTGRLRNQMEYAAYCDNLQHMEALAANWPATGIEAGEPAALSRRIAANC